MQKKILIQNMTCESCERTVKKTLLELPGIDAASVSYLQKSAYIKGSKFPSDEIINGALLKHGYALGKEAFPWIYLFGSIIVALVAFILSRLYGNFIFDPTKQTFTLGLVIVYGAISSLHCIGMCGGIALGASIQKKSKDHSILQYQIGRFLSYTLSGLILGLVGSTLQINSTISDVMLLIAGLWMVILALKMAGLLRLPSLLSMPSLKSNKTPFMVGLLNALMPCGSLQTMQILSLSLGNMWMGALTMALFALVTAPSLLFMQWIGQRLSHSNRKHMQIFAAMLVGILGLQMVFRSPLVTSALSQAQSVTRSDVELAPVEKGVQKIHLRIEDGAYTLDYADVQAGIPIQVSFSATQFLGCANPIEFDFIEPKASIDVLNNPQDLTFTVNEAGAYVIHCWMDMTKITLYVH